MRLRTCALAAVTAGFLGLTVVGCSAFQAQEDLRAARAGHEATAQEVADAEQRLVAAEARDQSLLSLGETLTAIVGTFVPTVGVAGLAGFRAVRKVRGVAMQSGTEAGIRAGAEAIIEGIAEARRQDPEFNKAFEDMDPKTKRAIQLVIGKVPEVLTVLNDARRN